MTYVRPIALPGHRSRAIPAIKLTAAFCASAKGVSGKQTAYPDADVTGLELRVSGDGRKTWSFRYRSPLGRQGRVTLGVYSREFDLGLARAEARKVRVLVDGGGDPAEGRRVAKQRARTESIRTFGDLAEAYFAATEAGSWRPKRASSLANERAVYGVHIKKPLGGLRVESVTRRTVKDVLAGMLAKGVTSQAVKAQAIVRQVLAYGVAEERIGSNPIADLAPVAPAKPRARIYTDAELRAIWRGVERPGTLALPAEVAAGRRDGARVFVGPAMKHAIWLAMLLLQRRTEILGMAITELDLTQGVWLIPAARMKTKRPHAVPLSVEAVRIIRAAISLNDGVDTALVFPSRVDPRRSINGPSMNHALGWVLRAQAIADGTVHDIRRTGSTAMTSERLSISPFTRSKVLGHADSGGGATVSAVHYDANTYMAEKRHALGAWQGLLATILSGPARPG